MSNLIKISDIFHIFNKSQTIILFNRTLHKNTLHQLINSRLSSIEYREITLFSIISVPPELKEINSEIPVFP